MINIDSIQNLNIPGFKPITKQGEVVGVRGRTLSAKKRRWMLPKLASYGVHTIIDLRWGDHSENFPDACRDAGIVYAHFPLDKSTTPNKVVIAQLPDFITTISQGGFYISCALGLHRTDIALALYYLFCPDAHEPPVLYGHIRDGKLHIDDIFMRAGSVYHNLTDLDKTLLGWNTAFEHGFDERKKSLRKHQEKHFDIYNST